MMKFFHRLVMFVALLALGSSAWAAGPALGQGAQLQTRNATANEVLNRAVKPGFWSDATKNDYPLGKYLYDSIWLRWIESSAKPGYMVLITGTGNQNFNHDVVSDIIINKQDRIDDMVDGAESVVFLGGGTDPRNGLPYRDSFYFLDMGAFYATYAQRMYRLDGADGRSFMFFEKLDSSFVDAGTWANYEQVMQQASDSVDRRSVFGSIVPVEQVFGMFMVNPDDTQESRVTFMAKLGFSSDNWVASLGSKMPVVLRAGLSSGFDACVQIAEGEQRARGL
ncbi:MAG: hypothetical protein ACI8S6_000885 [Myxococcota bacterium]|jgi:hypothetical protein